MHDMPEAKIEVRRYQAELQHLFAPRPQLRLRRGQKEERAKEGLREGARGTIECENPL